ncbi:MAG TPA: ABC transporter permease [Burkholderiaceae bacterium]|jgi:peptide/nickel transport system permease protein
MRQLARRHALACICLVFLLVLTLASAFAPWLSSVNPLAMSPMARLKPPSLEHWFGTDAFGRDVFVRTLYGGRVSLLVGAAVTVLATAAGTLIGLLSGYIGILDKVLMRVMDGIMSVPGVVLAVALMALFNADVKTVVIAIAIPEVPRVARLVRSIALSIREQEYVQAAVVSGSSLARVLFRHVLPNAAGPLAVQATFVCASAILLEAYLSFLGVGLPQDIPSWGNIMSGGRVSVQIAFWSILYPGVVLALTILSVNLLGDAIRDIHDPRAQK